LALRKFSARGKMAEQGVRRFVAPERQPTSRDEAGQIVAGICSSDLEREPGLPKLAPGATMLARAPQ
jgi:hypothetical protein